MSAPPTGVLFYEPRAKPLSVIGLQQPGAYYQFYLTGTTTLAPVYADGLLTTPLSQTPGTGGTTAAGDGRLVPIYLDPSTIYRLQLYNIFGILLEDTDPYVPVSVPSQAQIGQALFPQTINELNAGVTPTNYAFISGDVRRYGADPTGESDSVAAFQNAFKAVGDYGRVIVPGGQYSLASGTLPITQQADYQSIVADGDASITVTGTNVCTAVIVSTNYNGLTVSGLNFIGNSQANAYGVGGAIIWQNTSVSTSYTDFTVVDCSFQNFKGDYWVFVNNNASGTSTGSMKSVSVRNNYFLSKTGNARTPASTGADSACIGIQGSATQITATVEGIVIEGNTGECDFIKSLVVLYQSTRYINIENNHALRCGTNGISSDSGAYAIMLYNSSGFQPPSRFNIVGNVVASPFSCGVYLADINQGTISGNTITGQTDTADGTLPKGGVVINAGQELVVASNNLYNCYRAISIASGATNIDIKSNKLDSTQTSAIAIKVNNGVGGISQLDIIGNSMNMSGATAQGIFIQSFSGAGNLFTDFQIADNKIYSTQYCLQITSADSSHNGQNVRVTGNKLTSNLQHISIIGYTSPITVANNNFSGSPTSDGVDLTSSTQMSVIGNSFEDFSTTFAIKLNNTQGEFWGNSFVRCSGGRIDTTGSGQILGLVLPTWTGVPAMKVQTDYSGEGGTTGSKYLTIGWIYSGSGWLPMRVLDGN